MLRHELVLGLRVHHRLPRDLVLDNLEHGGFGEVPDGQHHETGLAHLLESIDYALASLSLFLC